MENKKEPTTMTKIIKVMGTIAWGIIIFAFISSFFKSPSLNSLDDTNNLTVDTQEEQRLQKIESQFSLWDGSHIGLTKIIKEAMNDPKSYDHIKTSYWDRKDHLIISTTFTGKNSFGGRVKNTVRAKVSLDGKNIEILEWN